jgi:hypothetical protein
VQLSTTELPTQQQALADVGDLHHSTTLVEKMRSSPRLSCVRR